MDLRNGVPIHSRTTGAHRQLLSLQRSDRTELSMPRLEQDLQPGRMSIGHFFSPENQVNYP